MPLKALIAPIAAATIVTAFWFAAMWRGYQIERGGQKLPAQYQAALFGYIGALGLITYLRADTPLSKGLDVFVAALAGEGLGIIVTFALVQIFVFGRGQPWRERLFPIFGTLFLAGLVFGGLLTS